MRVNIRISEAVCTASDSTPVQRWWNRERGLDPGAVRIGKNNEDDDDDDDDDYDDDKDEDKDYEWLYASKRDDDTNL